MLFRVLNENFIDFFSKMVILGRAVLVLSGISFTFAVLRKLLKDDAVRLGVYSVLLFFMDYVIFSGILLRFDSFGIMRVLIGINILKLAELEALHLRRSGKKSGRRDGLSWKRYLPLLVICGAGLFFVHEQNGYYGMQQDEGVYQTAALSYIWGNNDIQKTLDGYEILEETDRERFWSSVPTELNGLYFYDRAYRNQYAWDFETETTAYFHGMPTYPALLALWGGIFGFGHMMGIQALFYLLLLCLIFCFLDRFIGKPWISALGCAVTAVSPMIVWVGKSALTEMFLACILIAFIDLVSRRESACIWFSAVAVISFAFLHLTIYTLIPLFVFLYLIEYVRTRERVYLLAGMSAISGAAVAIETIHALSTGYFYLNIEPLMQLLPILNNDNVLGAVLGACIGLLAVFILLIVLSFRQTGQADKKKKNAKQWDKLCEWAVRISAAVLTAAAVCMIFVSGDGQTLEDALATSTLVGFCVLGGIILLPVAVAGLVWKPRIALEQEAGFALFSAFGYCVLIYCIVLRPHTAYYYYYGRYLVPYLTIVICQGLAALAQLEKKAVFAGGCAVVALLQAIFLLPYTCVLSVNRDDTRMDWAALNQVAGMLGENDILIVDDSLLKTCYLAMEFMTNATVLPQMGYSPADVMNKYSTPENNVYYLSEGESDITGTSILFRTGYSVSEDLFECGRGGILQLPLEFTQDTRYLQLNCLRSDSYKYRAEDDNAAWINMAVTEDGGRWGYGSEYGLKVNVEPGSYRVKVVQGGETPTAAYGLEYYLVEVYVNGVKAAETKIYPNEVEDLYFEIPAGYLSEGENTIMFHSSPWRPKDLGFDDYRELGINIKEIVFEKLSF